MNETEVGRLLVFVATVDQMMPSDEDGFVLRAWTKLLAGVPFELGERAAEEWYTSDRYSRDRTSITPADIVQRARSWQRPAGEGRVVINDSGAREPRPAFELDVQRHRDGVDRVIAEWQGRKAIRRGDDPEYAMEIAQGEASVRREFLSRPCGHCGASEGQPCTSPATGERLTKTPAHDSRIRAADVAVRGTREQALAELEQLRVRSETSSHA